MIADQRPSTKTITITTIAYADLLDWCHRHGEMDPNEAANNLLQRTLNEEYSRDGEAYEQDRIARTWG